MKPLLFTVLFGMVAVLLWLLLPHQPALPPTASQRFRRPGGVTQLDYRELHLHRRDTLSSATTYLQAAAMLGEGTLVKTSADGRTRTYQWNGGGQWGRLEATFHDGELVSKMQFLLWEY